jgi:diguanylate cyclase (GGDEF)-like protein
VNSRQIPELGWVIVVLQQNDPSKAALLSILAQNLLIALAVSAVVLLLANATVGNYQRQLQQLAITDKLTGLLNRTALDTLFNRVVKDALRRQEPLAVILFDIDFFKLINDSHGHAVGDQMIQHVAAVLQRSTRGSDLLFRWGGEEFLLLLPGCSASQAVERCERQRQILRSQPLAASSSSAEPIAPPTLSCGVTTYQHGETLKELLLRADQALYTAKRGGRDRVVCLEAEAPLLGRIDPKPSTAA